MHDYLNQAGGAERVVSVLHRLFPKAPVFTTIADPYVVKSLLGDADVRTTWMQWLPGIKAHYRKYFWLYPLAIEQLGPLDYDLVISSSSAYAKSVKTRVGAIHICYCHTPMRFAWDFESYAAREEWGLMVRTILPPMIAWLRRWDRQTSNRPTEYVANSSIVAERIRRHYGRSAVVIPPPIELNRFSQADIDDDYYLVVSRLVAYKRLDLVIAAFNRLRKPLLIVGDGPARQLLERMAGPTIRFAGKVSDEEVAHRYSRCRAVILPGYEDFGLVPLEANASGRPVIAFRGGGALDTLVPGKTGVFFSSQTPEALCRAVRDTEGVQWDKNELRRHAEAYSEDAFRQRFMTFLTECLSK